MTQNDADVLVIGAGVSGLSSAIALLDAGLRVTVYAADHPHRTTSAAAGALWGAHLVGTDDRIARWAAVTLDHFRSLTGHPEAGVSEIAGTVASADAARPAPPAGSAQPAEPEPPPFTSGAGTMSRADLRSLPAGYTTGWRYSAPVISMPAYLDYLLDALIARRGLLQLGSPLGDISEAEAMTAAPILVNCTGIGAREFAADASLVPVRGQAVVVANPGLSEFFVGEGPGHEVTYFFPHGATAVLGGTQQEGDSRLRPDPGDAGRIVAACAAVEPRLADAPVLGHRVGLRPVRPSVRLEAAELTSGRFVVHNYGHGGAGVTLSWGCAKDVLEEVGRRLG
jgi:D-amino-acid oxidase